MGALRMCATDMWMRSASCPAMTGYITESVIHLKIAMRDLAIPLEITSTDTAESAKWCADTERLSGLYQEYGGVMRGSVAAVVLALATVSAPANALSGPMPGSKLQNLVSTNVEPVVVVRRGGAVARGPRGGVAAVGRTTVVRPPGYRPGGSPRRPPRRLGTPCI
jgi:hypothetical protein